MTRYLFGGPIHPLVAGVLAFIVVVAFGFISILNHGLLTGLGVLFVGCWVVPAVYVITELLFMDPDDPEWQVYQEAVEYDQLEPRWYEWWFK